MFINTVTMELLGKVYILPFHGASEEKDSTATALSASRGLHGASLGGSIQNITVNKIQK